MHPKVFGIGFHKTGTTSLRDALQVFGYRVAGPNETKNPKIKSIYQDLTKKLSHEYDGFQDNPWPLVFREMDAMWPDALFVLTWREPERWISSQTKHFGEDNTPMREMIYGDGAGHPAGNNARYLEIYNAHNTSVRAHFADRPGKLLEMNFEQGDGWEKLCPFLGRAVPDVPFPHANAATLRDNVPMLEKLTQQAMKLLRKIR